MDKHEPESDNPGVRTLPPHSMRPGDTTMAERFRAARGWRGISQNRLGKLAGCTASTINQVESGLIVELKAALLFRISDVLEVSARWLLLGELPIHKWTPLAQDEFQLVKMYRALPERLQVAASSSIASLVEAYSPPSAVNPFPPTKKPR